MSHLMSAGTALPVLVDGGPVLNEDTHFLPLRVLVDVAQALNNRW